MHDDQLITRIRTGETGKALHVLYKHFPLAVKHIGTHGGNRQLAEDIFQEALLILVRKVQEEHFTLTAPLKAYLLGICRMLWQAELRKQQRQQLPQQEPDTRLSEDWLTAAVEEEKRAKLAEKALDSLKDRCRELLLLFYSGKMKLKEIAAAMGYNSENTAKNQKYKCLEAAREKLRELKQSLHTA
jgi:RNA polymerase sigma factor (sigma-70 family)